jgi:uncharacterized membrane protein
VTPPREQSARLAWIDLLRGLAVVGMIETHVVNAVLDARFDHAEWLRKLMSWNGLIAPMFLFIAGYAQGLAILRAHSAGKPVLNLQRIRRLALIFVIAYALHIPWDLWTKGDFSAESWRELFQADILQCMAVSLFAIAAVGHMTTRWHLPFIGILACAAVFLAPAAMGWQPGFGPVDAYLNRDTGSIFPLFPWFGFAACGCLVSHWKSDTMTTKLAWLVVGIVGIAAGSLLSPTPWFAQHPSFFFERLGWLLVFVFVAQSVATRFAPRWLMLASRESLLLYVIHLQLIYGVPINGAPLNLWLGRTMSLPATALVFMAVLVASMLFAWMNEQRKLRKSTAAKPSPASA